jgi:hypothetical protein
MCLKGIIPSPGKRGAESKNEAPADREVSADVQARIKDALRRIDKCENEEEVPEGFISLSEAKARVRLPFNTRNGSF